MTSRRRHVLRGEVLMDARQEQRHETRRRKIRWWRIGITLVTVSTLAGLIALYLSPALRVQTIEVSGTEVVSEQDVLDLIDLEGDSMLRIDTNEIAERVKTLSMVRDVSVERAWPKTVRIQISERAAWGYWKSGENVYPIDSEGTVLAGVTPQEGAPVIENTGPKTEITPSDRVDPDAVFLAQTLLERLPDTVSPTVGAIEYSSETGLSVQTSAGYRVVIGDSQNLDYKLSVWKALEAQLGAEGLKGQVLDLRFGDRPALMNGGDES